MEDSNICNHDHCAYQRHPQSFADEYQLPRAAAAQCRSLARVGFVFSNRPVDLTAWPHDPSITFVFASPARPRAGFVFTNRPVDLTALPRDASNRPRPSKMRGYSR